MKLAGLLFVLALMSFRAPLDPLDPVKEQFQRSFPGAGNVTWLEQKDFIYVRFEEQGRPCMAWYRPDGSLLRTHRYYRPAELPAFPRACLAGRYPNKQVFGATEIFCEDEGLCWLVRLQDQKHWFLVKVNSDGDMTLMEKFRKA